MEQKNVIECRHLVQTYGTNEILKGLSFKAQPFEITFLAGKNGAGKTTFFRIATGLQKPTSGSVTFAGKSSGEIRDQLAVVFDHAPFYPSLNGYSNIKILSGIHKVDKEWQSFVFHTLHLNDTLLKQKTKKLSFGQRHRLAVAIALLRKPNFLLLDEPSIGLDPSSWQAVKDSLHHCTTQGAAIIITGQNFSDVEGFANRMVVINDGTAVFSDSPRELIKRQPHTVVIKSQETKEITALYPQAVRDDSGQWIEIACATLEEAETVIHRIQSSRIRFREIFIRKASLEQAFQTMMHHRTLPNRKIG